MRLTKEMFLPRMPIVVCFLVLMVGGISSFKIKDAGTRPSEKNGFLQPIQNTETRIAVDVGLVVSDMHASLAFYRDLLGLEQVAEIETKLIGKGKMVQLRHGASLIKLLEMEKPAVKNTDGFVDVLGYRYITLIVPKIDVVLKTVEAHNIQVAMPITYLGNGAIILMVKDPEGNIVEFVQPES